MLRERSRVSEVDTPVEQVEGGVTILSPATTISKVESMTDYNNGRSRPPSSCLHYKATIAKVDRVKWMWEPWGPDTYSIRTEMTANHVSQHGLLIHAPIVQDWIRKCDRIISNASSVADEFSLLNNLVELDELPKLLLNYKSLAAALKSKGSLGSKSSAIADNVNYLQWEFGIAPVMADMKTLYNNIVSVRSRIQNLAAGKWQVLSKIEETQFRGSAVTGYYDNTGLTFKGSTKCTLSGEILAIIPGLHEAEFQLKALLDVFGVHLDAAFVWDAIPFTWLIDWFLPLGDYFESLNTSGRKWVKVDLEGQVYITTKSTGTYKTDVLNPGYPGNWTYTLMSKGEGNFAFYNRQARNFGRSKREQPLKMVIPDFDARKLAILASLAQAKRPR